MSKVCQNRENGRGGSSNPHELHSSDSKGCELPLSPFVLAPDYEEGKVHSLTFLSPLKTKTEKSPLAAIFFVLYLSRYN